jgi:predicted Zn-dependent protease
LSSCPLGRRAAGPCRQAERAQRGTQYAYAAGYRPDGLKNFLVILKPMVEKDEERTAWLNRTHPKTQDRIERQDKLMAEKKLQIEGRPDNFERYQKTMKAAAGQ